MNSLTLAAMGMWTAVSIASAYELQGAPRSVRDGVYTSAQANQGKKAYDDKCASCHGTMLTATPDMAPLLNDYTFQEAWKNRSLAQFFERIRQTMPQNEPGTLSPQVIAELVAYILSANKMPSGDVALPSDVEALMDIRLDAIEP
jgi:S-disulfanyl-L-cysteine oxidoreductase SoxD